MARSSATDGGDCRPRNSSSVRTRPIPAAPARDAAVASRTDPTLALTVIRTSPRSADGAVLGVSARVADAMSASSGSTMRRPSPPSTSPSRIARCAAVHPGQARAGCRGRERRSPRARGAPPRGRSRPRAQGGVSRRRWIGVLGDDMARPPSVCHRSDRREPRAGRPPAGPRRGHRGARPEILVVDGGQLARLLVRAVEIATSALVPDSIASSAGPMIPGPGRQGLGLEDRPTSSPARSATCGRAPRGRSRRCRARRADARSDAVSIAPLSRSPGDRRVPVRLRRDEQQAPDPRRASRRVPGGRCGSWSRPPAFGSAGRDGVGHGGQQGRRRRPDPGDRCSARRDTTRGLWSPGAGWWRRRRPLPHPPRRESPPRWSPAIEGGYPRRVCWDEGIEHRLLTRVALPSATIRRCRLRAPSKDLGGSLIGVGDDRTTGDA